MRVDAGQLALLFVAGVGSGIVGSTAGLASLVSYPALLAVGLSPISANVTNTVALIGSSVGSVSRSRRELAGQRRRIMLLVPLAAAAGAAGGILLLTTPPGAFEVVVPYLIALASVLLLLGPRLRQLRSSAHHPEAAGPGRAGFWPTAGLVASFVYGGYFGAAAGVMVLALLLLSTELTLARATALRNLVVGCANAAAAVVFSIFAPVRFLDALVLGVGCLVGGSFGPALVRRIPPTVLRVTIAVLGLGLAIRLWRG